MGAWGAGLYASDFAQDLRASLGAVVRLPFEPGELLVLLRQTETAADDPSDSDHTTFWLVVADQFAKKGVDCAEARDRALAIIAGGDDLATMAQLGMDPRSLEKRHAMLAELAAKLRATAPVKPRKVLKAPQPLLLQVGDAIAYPVDARGDAINPYLVGKPWPIAKAWRQAAWGALVVAERGRAFDFLAWYRTLVITEAFAEAPALADLWAPRTWLLSSPGTLTARSLKAMEFRSLGRIVVDPSRLDAAFPTRGSANWAAVNDITIANHIHVRDLGPHEAHRVKHGYPPTPRINALAEVATPIA